MVTSIVCMGAMGMVSPLRPSTSPLSPMGLEGEGLTLLSAPVHLYAWGS